MFIDNLQSDPAYYFAVVVCVTTSIVLHELGHGLAAIAQGDDTPIVTGHITWNPLVHMGPIGLGMLCIVGIAFGVMPVNPSRFRSPYGDAIVAAAGPLVNAALAILSLTAMAGLMKLGVDPRVAGVNPLWIMGLLNTVLCLFNFIPISPLDGSVVVGNFVPAYRDFIRNPANARYVWVAFGIVFLLAGRLFTVGAELANAYVTWMLHI
ncbi:MAG: site-2 protease family protein [bacterium]|nr:site-2 protease family protein [bacterium]